MALPNGVLVHGPTSWACAVRTPDGDVKVVAERKRVVGSRIQSPLPARPGAARRGVRVPAPAEARAARGAASLRGPARDRLDGRRRGRSASAVRRTRLGDTAKELVGGTARARAGAALAPRGLARRLPRRRAHRDRQLRARTSARAKEHERCGSHLVGPLLATATAGNLLAARAPSRYRSAARACGVAPAPSRPRPRSSAGCSATRTGGSPARSRGPATSSSTASRPPSRRAEQLEVAEAALARLPRARGTQS